MRVSSTVTLSAEMVTPFSHRSISQRETRPFDTLALMPVYPPSSADRSVTVPPMMVQSSTTQPVLPAPMVTP